MLLIDFNQTLVSNLMSQIGSNANAKIDENLVRHMVLSSILSYKKRFGGQYGQLVFCGDDKKYWRRDIFPYYKSNRKKARDSSNFDWNMIFNTLNKIRDEIKETFPYIVILAEGAEADDVIATMVKKFDQDAPLLGEAEPILILSGDKDFLQLQKYSNVRQYSPMQKKYLTTDSPSKYLKEHIIRGDSGDGIPNFLSPDDVFVMPSGKQKSIMQKKLDVWMQQDPEDFCDPTMLRNYKRNEQLIDLTYIPEYVEKNILEQYELGPKGNRSHLFNYFIKHQLKYLMESISDF